jgi:hypothetical protein
MDNVIKLLRKEPVTSVSTHDIFMFLSVYPEWLPNMRDSWEYIVRARNHVFCGEELDPLTRQHLLTFFLCSLVQISLINLYVFDEFIITENSQPVFTEHYGEPINVSDYSSISYRFIKLIQDSELSGVSFLLNIMKGVIK